MAFVIHRVSLMKDLFVGEMDWNADVIGSNVSQVNIEFETSLNGPPELEVFVDTDIPNNQRGKITLFARSVVIQLFGPKPGDATRALYRGSFSVASLGVPQGNEGVDEVATVARVGGTSQDNFVLGLGPAWSRRGQGRQPEFVPANKTGDAGGRIPDGRALFDAGGVEVLRVRPTPSPGDLTSSGRAAEQLIRNPADFFYYSGHGLRSGVLAIGPTPTHTYLAWLSPTDLVAAWSSQSDVDTLILAGCSVLHVDPTTTPPSGTGLDWANLLVSRGGTVTNLLGYQGTAPLDVQRSGLGGEPIADAFAKLVIGGATDLPKTWIDVNIGARQWNAAAIDSRGYFRIKTSGLLRTSGTLEGPFAI